MTHDSETLRKEAAQAKAAAEDLSEAIEQSVKRLPDEEVRSVRVFEDHYRCNWWVRDRACHAMFSLATGRIRRSSFLRVTRTGGKLVIEELSGRATGGDQ